MRQDFLSKFYLSILYGDRHLTQINPHRKWSHLSAYEKTYIVDSFSQRTINIGPIFNFRTIFWLHVNGVGWQIFKKLFFIQFRLFPKRPLYNLPVQWRNKADCLLCQIMLDHWSLAGLVWGYFGKETGWRTRHLGGGGFNEVWEKRLIFFARKRIIIWMI